MTWEEELELAREVERRAKAAADAADVSAIDTLDWIEQIRKRMRLDEPWPTGGPPPPPQCGSCGQPVDLSDQELYSSPRRRTCSPCIAKREAARRENAAARSVPPRFEWATLECEMLSARLKCPLPTPERIEAIMRADRVVFVGRGGTGKTSLAVALMREAARRGADAHFMASYRLATARAKYPLGEGEPPLVERARTAGLLLLDDVGNEHDTKMSDVRTVVFERHDYERPIWITTALSSRELGAAYGGGFLRRIGEGAVAVDCGGTS